MKAYLFLYGLAFTFACSRPSTYDFLGSGDARVRSDVENIFGEDETLIYAHSDENLYRYQNSVLAVVGAFRATTNMTDIAVNRDGELFGVASDSFYRIDPQTGEATFRGRLGAPFINGLTFVEKGTISADEEVLIGLGATGYIVRIDPRTGAARRVGVLPDGWEVSGDLVSVAGAGTYASMFGKEDCDPSREGEQLCDQLVRLEFRSDGSVSRVIPVGPIQEQGHATDSIWGLGYWGATLYGFTSRGSLMRIGRNTGEATTVHNIGGGVEFYGAGVTTRAYVIP